MKIKDLFKIVKQLRKEDGCLIITKKPFSATCTRYGNMTNYDVARYTKDFYNSN